MDVKRSARARDINRRTLHDLLFSPSPQPESVDKPKLTRRAALRVMLFCALCFLFSRAHAVWSAYPFGLALICASCRFVPLGLLSLCLGAGVNQIGAPVYIAVYILAVTLRLWLSFPRKKRRFLPESGGIFREAPQLRISIAIVSGFACAVYELLAGGLTTPSILYGVSMIAITVFFCALFIPYFESDIDPIDALFPNRAHDRRGEPSGTRVATVWIELSVIALLFVSVVSLSGIEYFSISADYCFAAAATLVIARRFGPLRGCAAGLICSLGAGLVSIGYTPAFALLGLVTGLLRRLGVWLSAAAGCVVGILLAIYTDGAGGIIALLPELVVSTVIALPIMKLSGVHGDVEVESAREGETLEGERGRPTGATDARLRRLGETFASLSDVFHNVSDTMKRPELSGGSRVSDEVRKKYCVGCPRESVCARDTGESLRATAERLAGGLHTKRDSSAFAELIPSDCPCLGQILGEVEEILASCVENRRRAKSSELFAFEYDGVAKLLSEAAERDRIENREDIKLGIRLREALREHGIVTGDVSVYGSRRKYVTAGGVHWEGRGSSADELRETFEGICGCRLSNPSWEIDGEHVTLEMSSVRALSAELFCASLGREAENGDVICSFENREDYFYALLSDGMGSGSDAAYASGICGIFLEKMLSAGNSISSSLKMLNNLMRNKGSEASASIDLLELDLIASRACFVKSGAAPSYVLRGDDLFRIRSKTVPIGILRALDAEQTAFDVKAGDLIVMLSDGIAQTPEEAPWLVELLTGARDADPHELAERILERARIENGGSDDMTVGVVRISEYVPETERMRAKAG